MSQLTSHVRPKCQELERLALYFVVELCGWSQNIASTQQQIGGRIGDADITFHKYVSQVDYRIIRESIVLRAVLTLNFEFSELVVKPYVRYQMESLPLKEDRRRDCFGRGGSYFWGYTVCHQPNVSLRKGSPISIRSDTHLPTVAHIFARGSRHVENVVRGV